MARARISAAKLYAILDREFRELRPTACIRCRIPLPYWQGAPDDVSANWSFGTPSECEHGCHVIMAEVLAKLWTLYDVDARQPSERVP